MDETQRVDGTDFVWSREKADANFRKHGVRFDDALAAFFDPLLVLADASRNGQSRQAVIGFDAAARLLFVVHAQIDGDWIRIVSARPATSREEELYAQ